MPTGWIRASFVSAGILAALAWVSPARAGAWLLPAGEGQAILSLSRSEADSGFGRGGRDPLVPDLEKTEVELLLEYGLDDETTLVFKPQMQDVTLGAPLDARRGGPGYQELGLRRLVWRDEDAVVSVQGLMRLPGARDEDDPASAGNTDADLDMRVLAGRGFAVGGMSAFVDAQLAYRARFGDPPGEIRADLTLGLRPRERLLVLLQSFNVVSDGSAAGIFEDGRYHKLQVSAVWEFADDWSVQLGAVATVAGEDALKERGVVAALWHRF